MYLINGHIVKAIKFTGTPHNANEIKDLIQHTRAVTFLAPGYEVSKSFVIENYALTSHAPLRRLIGTEGDWVVLTSNNGVFIHRDEYFKQIATPFNIIEE
jgi:hypothetical protein